jgi:hypothetical protein
MPNPVGHMLLCRGRQCLSVHDEQRPDDLSLCTKPDVASYTPSDAHTLLPPDLGTHSDSDRAANGCANPASNRISDESCSLHTCSHEYSHSCTDERKSGLQIRL